MANLNSTSPDIPNQDDNNKTPPPYKGDFNSSPNVLGKYRGITVPTKNDIANILLQNHTKQQTNTLSEDLQKELIEKLKKLPDFE
jgi:hypothetical protein